VHWPSSLLRYARLSMSEPKSHHYVPQAYLNHFGSTNAKGEYEVHFLNKADLKKPPARTGVRVLCAEYHGYRLTGATRKERQFVEDAYADIWDKNYNMIHAVLTDDSVNEIDPKTRDLIISTITTMLFRTRRLKIATQMAVEEKFETAIRWAKENESPLGKESGGHITVFGTQFLITGKSVKDLVKEYEKRTHDDRVVEQLQRALHLATVRKNDRVTVYKSECNNCYLTSDHPVGAYNAFAPLGAIVDPLSSTNTLSLPIGPKYRVELAHCDTDDYSHLVTRIEYPELLAEGDVMAHNNETQLMDCERFVIGDEATLSNFDKHRWDVDFVARIRVAQDTYTKKLLGML
jgi:hypothetical protein